MFAVKSCRTLACAFGFSTLRPAWKTCLSQHAWSQHIVTLLVFACWLISLMQTNQQRVCVGHASGANPWLRAGISLSRHSGSVWTVKTPTLCFILNQPWCTRLSCPPPCFPHHLPPSSCHTYINTHMQSCQQVCLLMYIYIHSALILFHKHIESMHWHTIVQMQALSPTYST